MPYMNKLSGRDLQIEGIKRTEFAKKQSQRLGLQAPSIAAYDFLSGCIVYEMACLRCNCSFKANFNNAGDSYNLRCPYCYREDQLRMQKGRLL